MQAARSEWNMSPDHWRGLLLDNIPVLIVDDRYRSTLQAILQCRSVDVCALVDSAQEAKQIFGLVEIATKSIFPTIVRNEG